MVRRRDELNLAIAELESQIREGELILEDIKKQRAAQ